MHLSQADVNFCWDIHGEGEIIAPAAVAVGISQVPKKIITCITNFHHFIRTQPSNFQFFSLNPRYKFSFTFILRHNIPSAVCLNVCPRHTEFTSVSSTHALIEFNGERNKSNKLSVAVRNNFPFQSIRHQHQQYSVITSFAHVTCRISCLKMPGGEKPLFRGTRLNPLVIFSQLVTWTAFLAPSDVFLCDLITFAFVSVTVHHYYQVVGRVRFPWRQNSLIKLGGPIPGGVKCVFPRHLVFIEFIFTRGKDFHRYSEKEKYGETKITSDGALKTLLSE